MKRKILLLVGAAVDFALLAGTLTFEISTNQAVSFLTHVAVFGLLLTLYVYCGNLAAKIATSKGWADAHRFRGGPVLLLGSILSARRDTPRS